MWKHVYAHYPFEIKNKESACYTRDRVEILYLF